MKKYFFILFLAIFFTGCNEIRHHDLYEKTDYFVESLNTTFESYGLLGGQEYTKYAENGKYRIMPTGRLVNVRIEQYASSDEYEDLRRCIERHYYGDTRVNSVYICGGGTIMIDCRR